MGRKREEERGGKTCTIIVFGQEVGGKVVEGQG